MDEQKKELAKNFSLDTFRKAQEKMIATNNNQGINNEHSYFNSSLTLLRYSNYTPEEI